MSSPSDSPSDDALGHGYSGPWIWINQAVLVFCGAIYALIGLGFSGLYTAIPFLIAPEGPEMFVMVPVGVFVGLIGVGFGVLNVVAAWGLGQRRMWAWVIAVILAFLYLPSACMPFGAVIAWGLLVDEPTRREFLG